MYGCEPYIQFSTPEFFCILTLAAAKAFSLPLATTGIAGGFLFRQKTSGRELPLTLQISIFRTIRGDEFAEYPLKSIQMQAFVQDDP